MDCSSSNWKTVQWREHRSQTQKKTYHRYIAKRRCTTHRATHWRRSKRRTRRRAKRHRHSHRNWPIAITRPATRTSRPRPTRPTRPAAVAVAASTAEIDIDRAADKSPRHGSLWKPTNSRNKMFRKPIKNLKANIWNMTWHDMTWQLILDITWYGCNMDIDRREETCHRAHILHAVSGLHWKFQSAFSKWTELKTWLNTEHEVNPRLPKVAAKLLQHRHWAPDGRETLSGFDIYDNEMLWWVLKLLSLVIRPGQWKIQCTGNMFEFFICPGLGIVWAPTFMHVNDDVCVLTMILIPKQKMIFHFFWIKNCMHIFNIFPKFGKRNCVLVISKCFLVIDKQWWIYRAGKKHKNIISKC